MSAQTHTHLAPVEARPPAGAARYVPILQWLPQYKARYLRGDLIASVTVWALLVPEAMAYAAVAGLPVQYGLYAVPLAGLGYMVFGGSRHLWVGPDAAPAAVTAAVVVGVVGASASSSEYIAAVGMLAVLTGVLFLIFGLLRLGWIAKFFAEPILAGFVFGLGWFIAIGQLVKIAGIPKQSGDSVRKLVETFGHIGSWNWTSVVVGVIALALLFGLAKFVPKIPAAIVVVVLGILAVKLFDLSTKHGVSIVGNVPKGFHFASWSSLSAHDVYYLIPGAFAVLLVAFSQSVALAKTFAEKYHEPFDANQELFGYGAACLGAGGLQGYAATGSLSKSALSQEAGAETPLNQGITAILIVVTVLFLTGLFKNLPEAVLGAVIIHAVSGAMRPGKLVRLWRANRMEFGLAALTVFGVLVINILPGILIGVLGSFFLLIRRLDHPRTTLMGLSPDHHYYTSLDTNGKANGDVNAIPGVLIYGFQSPLVFTNYEDFSRDLFERIDEASPRPETVVIDCDAISETDTTGSGALHDVHATLERADIHLLLARVHADVLEYLKRDGVLEEFGADAVYPTIGEAVEAAQNGSSTRRKPVPDAH
jgi:sulfate permease, SulP family